MSKLEKIKTIMEFEDKIVLASIKGDFKLVGELEVKLRELLEDIL